MREKRGEREERNSGKPKADVLSKRTSVSGDSRPGRVPPVVVVGLDFRDKRSFTIAALGRDRRFPSPNVFVFYYKCLLTINVRAVKSDRALI